MADTKYPTRVPAPTAHEMRIDIEARGDVCWEGTIDQLRSEGLIRADVVLPQRNKLAMWEDDTFEFWMSRFRPPGMKGPMRLWVEGDWWRLHRRLLPCSPHATVPASVYAKQQALAQERRLYTSAGALDSMRQRAANDDGAFQRFKLRVMTSQA
ncbi:MAG TPA: hypothetical protein PKV56_14840 [Burkholderiaceae bacterium]|nr:hypothetical protein [Burkholderiaceae bacterium]